MAVLACMDALLLMQADSITGGKLHATCGSRTLRMTLPERKVVTECRQPMRHGSLEARESLVILVADVPALCNSHLSVEFMSNAGAAVHDPTACCAQHQQQSRIDVALLSKLLSSSWNAAKPPGSAVKA